MWNIRLSSRDARTLSPVWKLGDKTRSKTVRKRYRTVTSGEEAEIAIRKIWGLLPASKLHTVHVGSDERLEAAIVHSSRKKCCFGKTKSGPMIIMHFDVFYDLFPYIQVCVAFLSFSKLKTFGFGFGGSTHSI